MIAWGLSLATTYGILLVGFGCWCLKNKLKDKNNGNA